MRKRQSEGPESRQGSGHSPGWLARKAENYVLLLLKFRPRSTKEVQERLLRKGFESGLIRDVTDGLTVKGLLNDREFVGWWVRDRISYSPRGKSLLRRELRVKGISDEEIEEAFRDASIGEESEYWLAREVALRKLKRATDFCGDKIKFKRRLFSYLQRRGFSLDTIRRVINELLGNFTNSDS